MKWYPFIIAGCVGALLLAAPTQIAWITIAKKSTIQLSQEELQLNAQSITVKILAANDFLGSGVIIHQKGEEYWIVTNHHVIQAKIPLNYSAVPYAQIQTPDGIIHIATLMWSAPSLGKDLAILKFTSPNPYTVAQLGKNPAIGDSVLAAGFPFPLEEGVEPAFQLKPGTISQILDKPLEGGYQIGYTNDVEKGMSGGPLLNRSGEVVSINGLHANPLWGNPYLFEDGSEPNDSESQTLSQYSWGIPIETILKLQPLQSMIP